MFGRYYQFGWTGAEDGTAIDRANNIYLFSFGYAAGCESGGRAGDEFASGVIPENGNRIPTGRGSPKEKRYMLFARSIAVPSSAPVQQN